VPYRHRGVVSRYVPDFIAVTDKDLNVIIEIKGRVNDDADAKAKAAERWVEAVNRTGGHGTRHYIMADDPRKVGLAINGLTSQKWDLEQRSANLPLFKGDQLSSELNGRLLQHSGDMPDMDKIGQILFERARQEHRDFFQLEHIESAANAASCEAIQGLSVVSVLTD
jgi:type III restriction enzyme